MSRFDYPLLFEPIPVPKVWGGGKLARVPGRKTVLSENPIGESWDVSTWPTAPDNPELITVTKIINGPLAGTPLDRVTDVPVVVKVIDSADKLSVQNHPALPDVHKNEMWYILDSDEGSYLYLGLREGISANEMCGMLRTPEPDEETLLGMMVRYDEPQPGSYFNVPTGTVHALGPGLLTFEISEKSQVTYRLYDYNRERSRGKLDIEDGCIALTTQLPPQAILEPGIQIEDADKVETITQFATFCVIRAKGDQIKVTSADKMHLVTATMGKCAIKGPRNEWNIELPYTATCLVPATNETYTIDTRGSGEVLISPLQEP